MVYKFISSNMVSTSSLPLRLPQHSRQIVWIQYSSIYPRPLTSRRTSCALRILYIAFGIEKENGEGE